MFFSSEMAMEQLHRIAFRFVSQSKNLTGSANLSPCQMALFRRKKPTFAHMNINTKNLLEQSAKEYVAEHADPIEIFELIVPFYCVPKDEEDPEEWAALNAPELDAAVGFTIVPVSCAEANGFALLTVAGNSWEGLRISVAGVFDSISDARSHVETLGIIC